MAHFIKVVVIWYVVIVISGLAAAQDNELLLYEWGDVRFEYPEHWEIVLEDGNEDQWQVKLVPPEREDLSILLSLFDEFPEPDEDYWAMPAKSSMAFGLGLALNLAGEAGEKAIALHYGSIELADGPAMSARFTIFPPDTNVFVMLECFHAYNDENGGAYLGMILTQGFKGQTIDDPEYVQYIEEAYAIVRNITIE